MRYRTLAPLLVTTLLLSTLGIVAAAADGGNEYTSYDARGYDGYPYYDDYGPAYGYDRYYGDGYYDDDYGGYYPYYDAYGYDDRPSVHIQFGAPGFYFSFGN